MVAQTIYCQIEDDLRRVSRFLEDSKFSEIVLVFPKRSYLFGDSLNLRLLKKHADILGKRVVVVTADERGQVYARDAGFTLKPVRSTGNRQTNGDIRVHHPPPAATRESPIQKRGAAGSRGIINNSTVSKPKIQARTSFRAEVPRIEVKDTIFPDVSGVTELLTNKRKTSKERSSFAVWAFVGLLFGVLLGSVVAYPTVAVYIVPKSEDFTRSFEVILRPEGTSNAAGGQLVLPSQVIDRSLEAGGKFSIDGKKEIGSKARGKVKIVNLSGLPLTLRASTTALTSGSKKYQLVSDQNAIPAITAEAAADTDAGQEAEVVAVESGQSSNLPPGTRLEITNQVFGSRPATLFARVNTEITGGNSRFVSVVTASDTIKIKDELSTRLVSSLRSEFQKKGIEVPAGFARVEIADFKMDKQEGAETPSVNAELKARIVTIGFEAARLLDLLRPRLEKNLGPGKKIQPKNLDLLEYAAQGLPDQAGNGKIVVEYKSKLSSELDLGDATRAIYGSYSDSQKRVETMAGVANAKFISSPSWWNRAPLLSRRVSVSIQSGNH